MREICVIGVGMTNFGVSIKTNLELFSEAAFAAFVDSGLSPVDMEALFFGNCLGAFEEGQLHMAPFAAARIGMSKNASVARFESACATGSVAFRNAALLVASGVYDVVLVAGAETATRMGTPLATKVFAMASDAFYEGPAGLTFPGIFAMAAHQYISKYRLDLLDLKRKLAHIAIKNHKHAVNNSKAHFQKEITETMVMNSEYVADPLRIFDCCPFSDGAAAVILASDAFVKKLGVKKTVWVAGLGQATNGPLYMQRDLTKTEVRILSIKQAMKQANITSNDIDVVELHDCFTIAEVLALEALGFYEWGEGYNSAFYNETSYGGKVVINPSGGLKAKGHPIGATGIAQICEIVWQLREEAGKRQVEDAKVGLTDTLGGDFSVNVNIIFKK